MRRGVKNSVLKRIAANRQRAEEVQQREEREAAALRVLRDQRQQKEK